MTNATRKELTIGQCKVLLGEIFAYNLERFERGDSPDTFLLPFFVGDPGCGKTSIPKQVARELGTNYFQTIVAQFDPGELAGLPFMGEEKVLMELDGKTQEVMRTRMIRLRPSYLPDIEDVNQHIGIYNLDELPQTMLAGQNVMSQLVNEWRIGEHRLSPGITICATGNKPENKAGTTPMPAHLKDRVMFIFVRQDPDEWLTYATQKGLDPIVRTYIRQNPGKLQKFTPGADANPTARSWEKTSEIMKLSLPSDVRYAAFCGTIGEGEATTYETFVRVKDKLPNPHDVIASPDSAPLFGNSNADVLTLLLASLADLATAKNIGAIIRYLRRLPNKEFNAVFSHDCFSRDKSLLNTKEVTEWKRTDGASLFFGG